MSSTNNLRNGYGAFISHSREDKASARELAGFICARGGADVGAGSVADAVARAEPGVRRRQGVIVDALLEGAGSLLIPVQDEGSPPVRRLTGRGVPFAMLDAEHMGELNDGDLVEIEAGRMRVVSNRA